jgi:hypothetical protein
MASPRAIATFVEAVVSNGLFLPPGLRPTLNAPEGIQGFCAEMLRDDYNYLVARWFTSALFPSSTLSETPYPLVYEAVRAVLASRYPHTSPAELHQATTGLARIVRDAAVAEKAKRKALPVADRYILLGSSGRRCRICGFTFPDAVVDAFLGGRPEELPRHPLYDFLKPTWRSPQDFRIEVDHIWPIARGGTNDLQNLQLLCGFCNRAKRDLVTLFDAGVGGIDLPHPHLKRLRLSSWFLVVRVLAGSRCHFCGREATATELTVAPYSIAGDINPVNVLPTCYHCDPIKLYRYVPSGR